MKTIEQLAKEATKNAPLYGRKEFTFSATELEEFRRLVIECNCEWQPIETAPRDGSWIVVTSSHNKYFRAAVQFIYGAWFDTKENDNSELMRDAATHWMPILPLPAAPKPGESKEVW